jgi:energy-converting hydrogenase A subunit M
MPARNLNLTDDDLRQGIAENTDAMSTVVHQQLELAQCTDMPSSEAKAKLMRFNGETISKIQREYQEFIAELRRRHL